MFGSSPLLLQSFIFLNLLEEDWVVRLGVRDHGSQDGLVDLGQPGLAGRLVSDGEESGEVFLPQAGRDTAVLHGLRLQLQVQAGLGGGGPLHTEHRVSY